MQFKEQISIQNSFSVQPVEPLNKTILHRSARLRVLNANMVLFCPRCQFMRGELRSVIHSDPYRFALFSNHPVQYSCHSFGRQRGVNLNSQCFPGAIVYDVQRSERSSTYHAVTHKVHAPRLVDGCFSYQQTLYSRRQPSFTLSSFVQLQQLVHPVYFFVVPASAVSFQVSKQLSKAITGMFKSQILQGFCDF